MRPISLALENHMNHKNLLALLRPETEKIDQAMRQDLAAIGSPLLAKVLDYAVFNGGKRVRPLLTVLAARLGNGQGRADLAEASLYRFALTFEYLHAASLLHDDVIDRAEKRRGRQTANRVWDNNQVILAGDFLHSRAMYLAGTIGGSTSLAVICRATANMVESEFLQLENADQSNTSEENYFQVLNGKTAALIAAACETGVLLVDDTNESRRALNKFGTNLGLTFQIVDDLLDYLGDPRQTGKAVGNDFQERKMTLPLLHALRTAPDQDRDRLHALLRDSPEARLAAFSEARQLIAKAGGFTAARQQAEELIQAATAALAIFPESQAKATLLALAAYVLQRDK